MAKRKFQIGDRVVNNGHSNANGQNPNTGKYGTVVDYDSNVREYAIVYDDGGTGVGEPKYYDAVPHSVGPSPTANATIKAKKELAKKSALFSQFVAAKTGSITISSSGPLSSADLQKAMSALMKVTQSKINNNMAMPTYSGSGGSGGYNSMSGMPTFMFSHPDHGNLEMQRGMPVVLLAGKGFADPGDNANPIWAKTGVVGRVRDVRPRSNGEIEADIEWMHPNGLAQRNLYIVNNGSAQLQFADWAPPFKPKPKLDDNALSSLVLEDSVKKEIMAVLKQHEHRDKLFTTWGLGETIEYGRGMTMMFWGGPGTGKTWGAHCIAKALGTELLSISAAEIQSSEPGAAERNIQAAFKEAEESGKVLFLDECDSLITTRADLGLVLAATVNCLLTEIEKFEGVCILATNRIETMDEALERRLALIVEFPFPKYAQRKQIWEKLLPKKLPMADGLTVDILAQPKFSGGQIKNIILQAARLAVSAGKDVVEQADFDSAVERLKKSKGIMGKLARSRTGRPGDGMTVTRSSNPQIEQKVEIEEFLSEGEEEH